MKTDAEILAIVREELKRPAITYQGLELYFGLTHADTAAIYRLAFKDGSAQRDRLLSALRNLVNEPQDITSKAYQEAVRLLGEFERNSL